MSALSSRPPIGGTADQLIRRVVANELGSEERDHSHWMFRLETATKNGQQEVDEVAETKEGDLKIPILINGREGTPKQREEGANRLEQLVHNPEALRKSAKDKNQDAARSQQLLRILPDAFIFNLGERHGNLSSWYSSRVRIFNLEIARRKSFMQWRARFGSRTRKTGWQKFQD